MSKIVALLLGIVGLFFAMLALSFLMWEKSRVFEETRNALTSAKEIEADIPPANKSSQTPAWVGAPPRSVGDAYQMSIVVGPYTTRAECDAQLPEALQEALDRYVKVCLGGEVGEPIVLPADDLRKLVKDQWEEVRQYSVGPMTRLHVLLRFDRKVKQHVLDEHRRSAVAGRLWFAGVGWTAWLALLGVVYGYLRIAGRKSSLRFT